MAKNSLFVEIMLFPEETIREHPSIGTKITVINFWVLAVDQDSNISWRMPIGKSIRYEFKPSADFPEPFIEVAGDTAQSVHTKITQLLTDHKKMGNSPESFFDEKYGWEKFKGKMTDDGKPF